LRPIVTHLSAITSLCVAAAIWTTGPGAMAAPASPAASTRPEADPSATDVARAAREQHILQSLSPRFPPGVEGMRRVGSGTGFFIASNRLLTNFHVVGGCRAMTVGNNSEGEEVDAEVIATDPRADLAVLSAEEKDIHPAQFLADPLTESREDLAIVGYPEHGLPVLQAELHHISVYQDDLLRGQTRYNFFGNVRRGNSGGPLLDSQGAVVGVVTAKIDTVAVYRQTGTVVDDVGIAISNRTVFAFLAANKISFKPTESAAPGTNLPADELLQKAHSFVRQVSCWK
jgi:serine protease Do